MPRQIRSAAWLLLISSVLTGIVYPLTVTGIAWLCFPAQAGGSLIQVDGKLVGSALLGQSFTSPGYFWSRPSATTPQANNGASSSGSNLGPTNPAKRQAIADRVAMLRASDPDNRAPIPIELVTASASGLDPHIPPAAALWQAARVARARHLDPAQVQQLISRYTEGRTWHLLGEPRVNVLELNLALDAQAAHLTNP